MKTSHSLGLSWLVLFTASSWAGGARASAPAGGPRVTGTCSAASADAPDETHPCSGRLPAKATLSTPSDATAVVVLDDGVRIHVHPNSRISLKRSVSMPAERGTTPVKGHHVALRSGAIDVEVPTGETSATASLVTTPEGATIETWRGRSFVRTEDHRTVAAVYEGAAMIGNASAWKPAKAGTVGLVTRSGAPSLTKSVPEAVRLDDSSVVGALPIAFGQGRARAELRWRPTADSKSYQVEIARDRGFSRIVSVKTTTEPTFRTPLLAAGTHHVRVRSIASDGSMSAPGAGVPIRVVGATLPPLGFVAKDGAIVLPEGRSLKLVGAEDLRAAGGIGSTLTDAERLAERGQFFPAPRDIVPPSSGARVVRLKAGAHEARIRIVKRTLAASFSVTPKAPVFPYDTIRVAATVFDPSHRIDPHKERVRFDVRVNGKTVPTRWTRAADAARFSATIMPQVPPGPWLVEVRALDAQDQVIGSTYTDVDAPAGRAHISAARDVTTVRVTRSN